MQRNEKLPQHVKDAAARMGEVPYAAPNNGAPLPQPRKAVFPELEPPPAPLEYRAAPTAPGEAPLPARPAFGERPRLWELTRGTLLRVRARDPRAAAVHVGGLTVGGPDSIVVTVSEVRSRSESHLRALLDEPAVEVEMVEGGES